MKECNRCRLVQPLDCFAAKSPRCRSCQKVLSHNHYIKHKKSYIDRQRLRRAKFRKWIVEYKQQGCCFHCGEKDFRCLDFHHRNPKEKIDIISQIAQNGTFQQIKDEIAKCDLMCANCHRKLHYDESCVM